MSKNIIRSLLGLIIIGLILPTIYIAASSLAGRNLASSTREYRYSNAKVVGPSRSQVQLILSSLSRFINPNGLNRLHDALHGLVELPGGNADPLGEYITALFNFTSKMIEIDTKLQAARTSIASGNTEQALGYAKQLDKLRADTRPLENFLHVLLDRISITYGIDTTAQLQKLRALDSLFQMYSVEIDQLDAQLRPQQGFIQTMLSLNASQGRVFIQDVMFVYGFLRAQNGTALSRRTVTVSWADNKTTTGTTDPNGEFNVSISFPIGFLPGSARIAANFFPQGADSNAYLPSTVFLEIQVLYRPSRIVAEISPTNVKPLDYADLNGNLTTSENVPLASKLIQIQVDETSLGNTTTNSMGEFTFRFSVPRTLNNGAHNVTVTFPATNERFAPAGVTLPLIVEILETKLYLSLDRSWVFSGMKLAINGTVTYANGTAASGGNITVYFDDQPYSNMTVKQDGTFLSPIQLPAWLSFGVHPLRAEYVPDKPWVQNSRALAQILIYNTPVTLLAGVAILAFPLLGVYLIRKNRRRSVIVPVPTEQPVDLKWVSTQPEFHRRDAKEEFSPGTLISTINSQGLPAARIRKAYRVAQAMISQKGEASRNSETHWEYLSKVTKSMPVITDNLRRLTEFFELAEYSPYPVESAQSREATEVLLKLREQLETVK